MFGRLAAQAKNEQFDRLVDAVQHIRRMASRRVRSDARTLCAPGDGPIFSPNGKAALLCITGDEREGVLQRLLTEYAVTPILDVSAVRDVIDAAIAEWPRVSIEHLVAAVCYYAHYDAFTPSLEALQDFLAPIPKLSELACACGEYGGLSEERREGLAKRFTAKLARVATHRERGVTLFECRSCGRAWQNRYANSFLFEVPRITTNEWLAEPFADVVQWNCYRAWLAGYLETTRGCETKEACRIASCPSRAIEHSVFCVDHQIASGSAGGPGRPEGRALP